MSSKKLHLVAEKRAILAAAHPLVPAGGWTDEVLTRAAVDAGYDRILGLRAFPGGAADLVDFSIAEADRGMLEALSGQDLANMRIRDRIAHIVRTRLDLALPHREAIRRTLAYYALPGNAVRGLKTLGHTASEMWYAAGDTATDYNWYTKRALLSGVYMSTLSVWLNDESEGQQETWEFLARRIDNVMKIQKLKSASLRKFFAVRA